VNEAERWARVSETLSRALDLPERERTSYLAEAIRDEPILRTETLSLFEELREVDAFLEKPAEG
jgi:hypothetical protein